MIEALSLKDIANFTKEPQSLLALSKHINIDNINISALDAPLRGEPKSPSFNVIADSNIYETLKEQGFSDKFMDNINSIEEIQIYSNANLESRQINGKDVLIRSDINLEKVDDFGRTNQERMFQGLSPLDPNGIPYQLHHIGQKADSPLAELTREEHIGKGNNKILHDVTKESEIDRGDFNKERAEHWKAREANL